MVAPYSCLGVHTNERPREILSIVDNKQTVETGRDPAIQTPETRSIAHSPIRPEDHGLEEDLIQEELNATLDRRYFP